MAKEIISGIYEIKNLLNGHRYIGSSVRMYKRWYEHERTLNKGKHHSIYLQRAWNKYGQKHFEFNVLEECEPIKETLEFLEQKYIDGLNPEYNICKIVGKFQFQLGIPLSDETKLKISKANKGRPMPVHVREILNAVNKGRVMSEEQKLKISKANKGRSYHTESSKKKIGDAHRGENNHLWGKKMTGDQLEKVQIHLRKININKRKPLIMLDKNTGEELREFNSVHAAADYVEKSKSIAHISECARGELNSAYGYKWKFKEIEHASI